ncbi:TetR/AcrR family transcriptional regulator [Actinoplanes sp. N902-109]|uniref:TetR/AcrR family transcriptional regulator n=1 Tax=Actinoplanes sp. (strain N902-109) TaxID=649831 RepID=UPI0003293BAA|nr:TetR/AcrR family transcriptional regulator [Actinoplanes sp. N902-109]AGL13817.1 putative transcriptional regulator [Actinoplanes sp. N902-109]
MTRADAVRNRRAILLATEDLLTRHRPEQISMEQVAAAAGVGKGTVFHRFGSRMGLMLALMQERAMALGEQVRSGPPPLGPGAAPEQRLLAFLDAVVAVVARNKGLLAALGHAVTTSHRLDRDNRDAHPVYGFWHAHIAGLLAEARPGLDAELHADLLLAGLTSDPVQALLDRGEADRLAAALRTTVSALLAGR